MAPFGDTTVAVLTPSTYPGPASTVPRGSTVTHLYSAASSPSGVEELDSPSIESASQGMTAEEDIASVAGQLADLTRTVEQMANQLKALRERADSQQKRADTEHERAEIQRERIDLAARELTEVGERLQAAANALRESL
jgi:molecular chaperone GrpE (heat shock protein)